MPKTGTGEIQRKVLLLLAGGLALGLSRSPNQYFRILKSLRGEWGSIERDSLRRAIRSLYQSKLIASKELPNGQVTLILTHAGKQRVLTYNIEELKIQKPNRWDKKWRIVIFDIPEGCKKTRDILRIRLKQIGMIELQKSVFIHPYPCDNEVNFLIEFYEVRNNVRLILAEALDNELHLRSEFNLL